MGTELLTRRMDLIHSVHSTTYADILTMDTSYPVKLSGIVVKVFLATSNYTKKQANGSNLDPTSTKFIVKGQGNINDNIITEIPLQNVYDFAGHKFKNNGFIGNDYVISIIDIDNKKIYLHSLLNVERNDSQVARYHKELNYYCNGINDNVVLQEIISNLISLYDGKNVDFREQRDEFDLVITASEKEKIFTNNKFTINIVGKFGIDFSKTKFTYGGFNRQNRSSIMTIRGDYTSSYISDYHDKDMELILDWDRCYIPKIEYNNETCAAMYNLKSAVKYANGDIRYINYWAESNASDRYTPHFVDENNKPYGNLFPRRLVFMSIEGILPLNITIKNFSLTTFGVGIYCETESNKIIKLIDSKININSSFPSNNIDRNKLIYQIKNFDVLYNNKNNAFYTLMPTVNGSAIDINCFKPTVEIVNCKIKNYQNFQSNLIINSSGNMKISHSIIKDFNDYFGDNYYSDSFNSICLDSEYFYDYEYTEKESVFTEKVDSSDSGITNPLTNPNVVDSIILRSLFYNKINVTPNKVLISKRDDTNQYNNTHYKYLDFSDLTQYYHDLSFTKGSGTSYQISLGYTEFTVSSKFKDNLKNTAGCIKNIPILYRDSDDTYGLNNIHEDNLSNRMREYDENVKIMNAGNKESEYMPNLLIDCSTIRAVAALYQYNSNTTISNTKIVSKLFDTEDCIDSINLISGELYINNCQCDFDTRLTYYNESKRSINSGYIFSSYSPSFIKVYPQITSYKNRDINEYLYYNGATPYDNQISYPSVSIVTQPKLNINNCKFTLYPDIYFNIPNTTSNGDISSNYDNIRYIYIDDRYGNKFTNKLDNKLNGRAKKTVRFISTISNDELETWYSTTKYNNSTNLFNPLTAPNINISSSEFSIVNNFSNQEIIGTDNAKTNTPLCTIVNIKGDYVTKKKFENIISNKNYYLRDFIGKDLSEIQNKMSRFDGDNMTYMDDYGKTFDLTKCINVVKNNYSNNKWEILIYNFAISQTETDSEKGTVIIITKDSDGNPKADSYGNGLYDKDFVKGTTILQKIQSIGLIREYQFHDKLQTVTGIMDIVNIWNVYPEDLPHTGYYLYDYIPEILNKNDNNQISTIRNKFNAFGVTAFKIDNAVFNMNNCNIGLNTGNFLRNAYGFETMVKKSPRICFDFQGTGIYHINNTIANAWGTVLWSELHDTSYINYNNNFNNRLAPFDSTTLDLSNRGECVINNCNFMNYSYLRFRQTSEDWQDYLDCNYNKDINSIGIKEIHDKGNSNYTLANIEDKTELRKQKSIDNQKYQNILASYNKGLGQYEDNYLIFNESVRNGNEMPIIYIANNQLIKTQINFGTIKGNETVIVEGNVSFNNVTYFNNNNAMVCYINKLNNTELLPPSVYFNNCEINSIKDVINDRYIDRIPYLRNFNHKSITHELDFSDKGMTKYNNVITPFYVETDECYIELDGNKIIFKCNAYDDMYGINYNTRVRLLYFNKFNNSYSIQNNFNTAINIRNNDITMLFDCPIYTSGKLKVKVLPTARNICVFDLSQTNKVNGGVIYKKVNVINNKFNIMTCFVYSSEYGAIIGTVPGVSHIGSNFTFDINNEYVMYSKWKLADNISINIRNEPKRLIKNNISEVLTPVIAFSKNILENQIDITQTEYDNYFKYNNSELFNKLNASHFYPYDMIHSQYIYTSFSTPIIYTSSYFNMNICNNFIDNNINYNTIDNKYINKFRIIYGSNLLHIYNDFSKYQNKYINDINISIRDNTFINSNYNIKLPIAGMNSMIADNIIKIWYNDNSSTFDAAPQCSNYNLMIDTNIANGFENNLCILADELHNCIINNSNTINDKVLDFIYTNIKRGATITQNEDSKLLPNKPTKVTTFEQFTNDASGWIKHQNLIYYLTQGFVRTDSVYNHNKNLSIFITKDDLDPVESSYTYTSTTQLIRKINDNIYHCNYPIKYLSPRDYPIFVLYNKSTNKYYPLMLQGKQDDNIKFNYRINFNYECTAEENEEEIPLYDYLNPDTEIDIDLSAYNICNRRFSTDNPQAIKHLFDNCYNINYKKFVTVTPELPSSPVGNPDFKFVLGYYYTRPDDKDNGEDSKFIFPVNGVDGRIRVYTDVEGDINAYKSPLTVTEKSLKETFGENGKYKIYLNLYRWANAPYTEPNKPFDFENNIKIANKEEITDYNFYYTETTNINKNYSEDNTDPIRLELLYNKNQLLAYNDKKAYRLYLKDDKYRYTTISELKTYLNEHRTTIVKVKDITTDIIYDVQVSDLILNIANNDLKDEIFDADEKYKTETIDDKEVKVPESKRHMLQNINKNSVYLLDATDDTLNNKYIEDIENGYKIVFNVDNNNYITDYNNNTNQAASKIKDTLSDIYGKQ